jgi:mRNA interferase RelE/StbE
MKPTYDVVLQPSVEKDLRGLAHGLVARLIAAIEGLAGEPRGRGARKLTGAEQMYRLRVGEYRVIYRVDDEAQGS